MTALTPAGLDEIVFQVLLGRMPGKRKFRRPILEETAAQLFKQVKAAFDREPVLLRLAADIVVVGDIHGNIDDVLRIFERFRYPPARRYIFLGDYVDRGVYGTEVLFLLFALKLKYPDHIYMLRGNHESESLSTFYGFRAEIEAKYSKNLYAGAVDVFESLPLSAVIGERVFCVHGGLSPDLDRLTDIEEMDKPVDLSDAGVFTDMVWSDPRAELDFFQSNERGCGYIFGAAALSTFLDNNDIDLMVRSHEVCMNGVSWPYGEDEENVDRCLTVFSSSNYCGRGNVGATLHVSADLLVNVEIFPPFKPEQRRVLLPYWLYDMIAAASDTLETPVTKAVKGSSVRLGENADQSNKATT